MYHKFLICEIGQLIIKNQGFPYLVKVLIKVFERSSRLWWCFASSSFLISTCGNRNTDGTYSPAALAQRLTSRHAPFSVNLLLTDDWTTVWHIFLVNSLLQKAVVASCVHVEVCLEIFPFSNKPISIISRLSAPVSY